MFNYETCVGYASGDVGAESVSSQRRLRWDGRKGREMPKAWVERKATRDLPSSSPLLSTPTVQQHDEDNQPSPRNAAAHPGGVGSGVPDAASKFHSFSAKQVDITRSSPSSHSAEGPFRAVDAVSWHCAMISPASFRAGRPPAYLRQSKVSGQPGERAGDSVRGKGLWVGVLTIGERCSPCSALRKRWLLSADPDRLQRRAPAPLSWGRQSVTIDKQTRPDAVDVAGAVGGRRALSSAPACSSLAREVRGGGGGGGESFAAMTQ